MTKRFRYDTGCVIDQLENKVLSERQAVNHLNALHEENENLKHQLITLDGLYVSDKEDMSEVWRLDLFSDDTSNGGGKTVL